MRVRRRQYLKSSELKSTKLLTITAAAATQTIELQTGTTIILELLPEEELSPKKKRVTAEQQVNCDWVYNRETVS